MTLFITDKKVDKFKLSEVVITIVITIAICHYYSCLYLMIISFILLSN